MMDKDDKGMKPSGDKQICIAALKIDYPGRFPDDEIPSDKTRVPLNNACRALEGITAIAKILFANEVQRDAHGEDADVLSVATAFGLFEALIFLAEHGDSSATDLGGVLFREAMKGGA
jgi:hypothetical protein